MFMSTHSENQQEEESKNFKPLYYSELMETLRNRLRSKNILSKSSPLTKPPKEATLEVIFIKRN
jgi:hypothetical protein